MLRFLFPKISENFSTVNLISSPTIFGTSFIFFWGAIFALLCFLVFILQKRLLPKISLNNKILCLGVFFCIFPTIIFFGNNFKNFSLANLYLKYNPVERQTLEFCRLTGKVTDVCLIFNFLDYVKTVVPFEASISILGGKTGLLVNALNYYTYPYFQPATENKADYIIFYYKDQNSFSFANDKLYQKDSAGIWTFSGFYQVVGIIDQNRFILKKEK